MKNKGVFIGTSSVKGEIDRKFSKCKIYPNYDLLEGPKIMWYEKWRFYRKRHIVA